MSNSINDTFSNMAYANTEADLTNGASNDKLEKDGKTFLNSLRWGADPAMADAVNNMIKSIPDGTFSRDGSEFALQLAQLRDVSDPTPPVFSMPTPPATSLPTPPPTNSIPISPIVPIPISPTPASLTPPAPSTPDPSTDSKDKDID
jgi:hypothetical protein